MLTRRWLRSAPLWLKIALGIAAGLALWLAANAIVQVARKPTELFSPVSGALDKLPAQTWRSYEPIFRAHATAVITPDFLAALAQVESAGNPVARTRWRWRRPGADLLDAARVRGFGGLVPGTGVSAPRH